MLKKITFIAILALIAALVLPALSACGETGNNEETGNSEETTDETPGSDSAPAPTPAPTEPDTTPKKVFDEVEFVAFDTGADNFPYNVTNPASIPGMKFTVNFTIESIRSAAVFPVKPSAVPSP